MPKVFLECYGCTASQSDYEIALGLLDKAEFEIVYTPKLSDINILLTCAVKTPTEHRMLHRLSELSKTEKPMVVGGCLTKVSRGAIERINPKVSIIGPDSVTRIADVAKKTLEGKKIVLLDKLQDDKVMVPHIRTNPIIDIVQVSSGCTCNCSYCATKIARGDIKSYKPHLITKQVEQAVKEGVKEIWLTSQDMSAYGKEIGMALPELLKSVIEV